MSKAPRPASDRWQRAAHVLWLLLAVALVVKSFASPDRHTVFPKFAAGAEHWWERAPLYEPYEGLGSFRYPPPFALVMTPFAPFGHRLGGALWSLVQLAVYLAGLRAFARWMQGSPAAPRVRSWLAPQHGSTPDHNTIPERSQLRSVPVGGFLLLATIGAIRPLWNGQAHVMVSGALLLGACAMARGQFWRGGGWLALPVFLKVAPVATLGLAAVAFGRRSAVAGLVALTAGVLLPFLTAPPDYVLEQYRGFSTHVQETATRRWDSFRDFWTVWHSIAGAVNVSAYRVLQGSAALAFALWAFLLRSRCSATALAHHVLALGAVWQLGFGPAADYKSYVVLAPLSTFALLASLRLRDGRGLAVAAWLMTTILAAGAVERALRSVSELAVLILPCGLLLYLLWWAVAGRRVVARWRDRTS